MWIIKETMTYLYPFKDVVEIRYYGVGRQTKPYQPLIPYKDYNKALEKLNKLKKIKYMNAVSVFELIENAL